ncbi:acyl transferase/acyl hydrolase/lysophospholipase [Coemansia mojavensis]|nr:acyl transferase/acyl hydrolase/lysophospholipase [Coemansia mojavensis]
MLPPQLQKAWVAECAQACIDKEIHPELLQTTSVRLGQDICKQEAEFQQKRARHIHRSFAEFIGEPVESIDPRDIPLIGIAGSGGGFRAMVATLGSYRAMHLAGLAQCVTYDAAVSGSSWAIAALHTYANGNPLKVLDSVHEAMKTSMFSTANLSEFITENDGMAKRLLSAAKAVFKTVSVPPLSIVDLYGALLFRKLIVQHLKQDDDKGPSLQLDSRWVRLSAQSAAVDQGQLPMPLYTAVRHFIGSDDNDPDKAQLSKYQWFEFSPYEVGSIDHGAWIPSWAFGRPMVDGHEQFKIGEVHFGGILGAASSAFCASVKAMIMEIYMAVPAAVRSAMDPLLDRIEHGTEIAHPIPPYTLYNPFYQIASSTAELAELGSKPLLSLMDAGMDNNLPFAPLLRPERGVDVIVCLDASANIEIMPWFARAEAWASDHGVERWPWGVRPVRQSMNKRIRDDNIRCVVFDQPVALSPLPKPKSLPRPVTVLYLPLLPNPNFRNPGFDPETADFCGTFNDKWSSEQVDLLADLASFNMTQEIERIREAVKVAYKRKRAHRLYHEGL